MNSPINRPMDKIRILIADDHDIVRRGLRPLIETERDWEVCGEAGNGREAVELCERLRPDVVVLDVGMPEMDGVEATRQIKQRLPDTEILAFTGTESELLVHQLFAAGARACVLKSEAGEQLLPAIKALSEHKPYLTSQITRLVFDRYLNGGLSRADDTTDGLTTRERTTVKLLAQGNSNKLVAAELGISIKTVESHRASIMRKLGFSAFSELVRYAVRNRIVEP